MAATPGEPTGEEAPTDLRRSGMVTGVRLALPLMIAVASVLGAGGAVPGAIAAAILLNARYGPLGVSVAPALGGPVWKRFLLAQLVVDESWALAGRGDGTFDRGILVGAGLALYLGWSVSTAVGAFGGEFLGDPAALVLDAAFPALFLALLWPQLRDRAGIVAAAARALIALALIPVALPGVPIIAAAAGCLWGLVRR